MKNKKLGITILFIIYLVIVFFVFFNKDKKMVSIFTAIGTSIYIISIKRISKE